MNEKDRYIRKTSDGLWVKAEIDRVEGVVRVYWQTRHRFTGTRIDVIGPNGDVIDWLPNGSSRAGAAWVECGTISLDQTWFAAPRASGVLALLQYGAMRHVVELIVLGFGERPEEVVSWFDDIASLQWIVDCCYVADGGEFAGYDLVELSDRSGTVHANVFVGSQRLEIGAIDCIDDVMAYCKPVDKPSGTV